MRIAILLIGLSFGLAGCIHVERSPEPAKTTVIVPPGSSSTVVCTDGTTNC